jgi:hypothetical protein
MTRKIWSAMKYLKELYILELIRTVGVVVTVVLQIVIAIKVFHI